MNTVAPLMCLPLLGWAQLGVASLSGVANSDLRRIATLLAPLPGCTQPYYYQWAGRTQLAWWSGDYGSLGANLYDMATRRSTRLARFDARFHAELDPRLLNHMSGATVSPDGRWLVWAAAGVTGPPELSVVADLRSGQWVELEPPGQYGWVPREFAWDARGRTLLALTPEPGGVTVSQYRAGTAAPIRTARMPGGRGGHDVARLIGVAGKECVAAWERGRFPHWSLQFVRGDPARPRWRVYAPVALPPYTMLVEARPSPKGDRIAWDLFRAGWGQGQRGAGPAPAGDRRRTHEVWLSDWRGRRMRYVGAVSFDALETDTSIALRWLPDGRRLTFLCEGRLYSLAVARGIPRRGALRAGR